MNKSQKICILIAMLIITFMVLVSWRTEKREPAVAPEEKVEIKKPAVIEAAPYDMQFDLKG